MRFKTVFGGTIIAAIALIVASPFVASAIPRKSKKACIQRTAEEMLVPVRDVRIVNVGPMSAESGAVTLEMKNRKTKQTAQCRVNTLDNTVLSVQLTPSGSVSQPSSESTSATVPESGSFAGRGKATGSVFGQEGRNTDASLDFNKGKFSLSLYVPPGTSTQVQYLGSINQISGQNPDNPNTFVIDGALTSVASSADNLKVVNTSGACRIEVFDARITSVNCTPSTSEGAIRFEGMKQF
ncbi:MAG TPA: hypothetical protein V6D19_01980 [Stenomitos sp.]